MSKRPCLLSDGRGCCQRRKWNSKLSSEKKEKNLEYTDEEREKKVASSCAIVLAACAAYKQICRFLFTRSFKIWTVLRYRNDCWFEAGTVFNNRKWCSRTHVQGDVERRGYPRRSSGQLGLLFQKVIRTQSSSNPRSIKRQIVRWFTRILKHSLALVFRWRRGPMEKRRRSPIGHASLQEVEKMLTWPRTVQQGPRTFATCRMRDAIAETSVRRKPWRTVKIVRNRNN